MVESEDGDDESSLAAAQSGVAVPVYTCVCTQRQRARVGLQWLPIRQSRLVLLGRLVCKQNYVGKLKAQLYLLFSFSLRAVCGKGREKVPVRLHFNMMPLLVPKAELMPIPEMPGENNARHIHGGCRVQRIKKHPFIWPQSSFTARKNISRLNSVPNIWTGL